MIMNPKIKLLKLTKLQQDIIIGTLLGNSTMQILDIYNEKKVIMNIWQNKEDLEYLKFLFFKEIKKIILIFKNIY